MKTLRETKIGDTVRVVKLHGTGAVRRRIMDMGITRGVEVHVRKVAPLGDPVGGRGDDRSRITEPLSPEESLGPPFSKGGGGSGAAA